MSDIESLVARREAVKEKLEHLTQEKDKLDSQIRDHFHNEVGKYDAGEWSVQLRKNARFDPSAFEKEWPIVEFPNLYKPSPNLAAIKEELSPKALEAYYVAGSPALVIK